MTVASESATSEPDIDTSAEHTGKVRRAWVWTLLVAVVAAGIYGNALRNGFVFDDLVFITNGRQTESLSNLPKMFGLSGGGLSYRPVRLASYTIDRAIFGIAEPWGPFGFHLSNLIYHTISSILVLFLFRRLTRNAWIAVGGALLFALHPVHVDSVTYVSGRKDVLCTMFGLMSVLSYLRWRDKDRSSVVRTVLYTGATIFLFALAALSKEMAVSVPILIFLVEMSRQLRPTRSGSGDAARDDAARDTVAVGTTSADVSRHRSWFAVGFAALRRGAPMFGTLIVMATLAAGYFLLFSKGTSQTWHGGNPVANFATVTRVMSYYVWLALVPYRLVGDYYYDSFPLSEGFLEPAVIGSIVALAAIVIGLFVVARRQPLLWLGGVWFLVAFLPVSHIIPHHELVGERFMYLPSVGFCLAAAVLLDQVRTRVSPRVGMAMLLLVLSAYGVRTATRNLDYHTDATFWRSVVSMEPRNARARMHVGYNLYYEAKVAQARGDRTTATEKMRAAVVEMEMCLSLVPNFRGGHYNLGRVYEELGDHHRAIEEYREELSYREWMDARFNLGNLLGRLNRLEEALVEFEALLERYPAAHMAAYYAGLCHERLGNRAEALASFERALKINPDNTDAKLKVRALSRFRPDRAP